MAVLLKGAALIDGNGGTPIENSGILVEDKKIIRVGRGSDFDMVEEIECIDCSGKTIIPGVIDSHAHFWMEPYTWDRNAVLMESTTSICLRILENLKKKLRSGVTFVRECGGLNHIDIDIKKAVEEERIVGPDLAVCGKALSITGGHGWWFSRECDGIDEFVKGTREQIKVNADFIKIMVTGGYARPKMTVNHEIMPDTCFMSLDEIKAVVNEAHKMGKKVAAHCNGLTGVKAAVMGGVDSVEHGQFSNVNNPEVDDVLALMAKQGTCLVPTLSAYFKNYDQSENEKNYQPVIQSFQKAIDAGVKISLGTDSGVPWVGHEQTLLEIKHMVTYGMNTMQAIIASTKTPAELIGVDSEYGTLEPGKFADFVILNDNPLYNLDTLLAPEKVFKNGKVVD